MICDSDLLFIKNLAYRVRLHKNCRKESHQENLREIGRFLITAKSTDQSLDSLSTIIDAKKL